jgi:membrane fusion protein (multidrug efflux system)
MTAGYLQEIHVKEGQTVKKGELMFKIIPTLYKAKWEVESAEAKLAGLELDFTKKLKRDSVVSENEVALYQAKLLKATAKANLAEAEYKFTDVVAQFDGIVDRQLMQLGSLVKEGEHLTTLSDNSVMWVYFNVPEAQYLEYMAAKAQNKEVKEADLVLANGTRYPYRGQINTIEANFNNETGNIAFRADFPNPDRLLRHGQTGNVELHRTLHNALVIPQRATFEILEKRYVWVIDDAGVVHQREVSVAHEKDDIFIISKGLKVTDRIVLEGVRQVKDGEKVEEPEYRSPDKVLGHMKYHAE